MAEPNPYDPTAQTLAAGAAPAGLGPGAGMVPLGNTMVPAGLFEAPPPPAPAPAPELQFRSPGGQDAMLPATAFAAPAAPAAPKPTPAAPVLLNVSGDQAQVRLPSGKVETHPSAAVFRKWPELQQQRLAQLKSGELSAGRADAGAAAIAAEPSAEAQGTAAQARGGFQMPGNLGDVAYTLPGQSTTESQTSRSFTEYTPEQRKQLQQLDRERVDAQRRYEDVAGQLGVTADMAREQQVMAKEQELDVQNQAAARVQQIHQARNDKIAEYDARLNKLQDAYGKGEIQPYWQRQGTAGQLIAAIAVGLGAWAQAKGAKENPAIKLIEDGIRNDLEAQKSELARKREEIAGVRSLRADAASAFDDEVAQQHAQMALGLSAAKNLADQQAIKLQGTEEGKRAAELSYQLDQRRIAEAQQAIDAQAAKVTRQTQTSSQPAQRVTVGEAMGFDAAPDKKNFIAALGANAYSDADAQKVRDTLDAGETLDSNLAEMAKIQKLGAWDKLQPATKARYRSLWRSSTKAMSVLSGQGAMSQGEVDLAEYEVAKDASPVWGESDVAGTEATRQTIRKRVMASLRNRTKPVNPQAVPEFARRQQRYSLEEVYGGGGARADQFEESP